MPQKWLTGLIGIMTSVILLGCVSATEPAQTKAETMPTSTSEFSALSQAQSTPTTAIPISDALLEKPVSPIISDQEAPVTALKDASSEYDPGLNKLIDLAKADLAKRLSISVNEVTVLEARAVVWPDASLGCPQPGMAYIQVPHDGVLIQLTFQGKIYAYHGGGNRDPFLCEQPLKLDKEKPPQIDLLVPRPGKSDD